MTKEKWFNQLQCEPLFPLGNTLTNEMTNTQRQKNLVGVSALPTGKFLRVQKVFACVYKIVHDIKQKHQHKS